MFVVNCDFTFQRGEHRERERERQRVGVGWSGGDVRVVTAPLALQCCGQRGFRARERMGGERARMSYWGSQITGTGRQTKTRRRMDGNIGK